MFITRIRLESLTGLPEHVQALPAVRALNDDTLSFSPITILTGENGSGKSTIIEALAVSMGANPEGGSRHARFDMAGEDYSLGRAIVVTRTRNPKDVFFVRGESFLHLGVYYESLNSDFSDLPERSHGEGLMAIFRKRIDDGLVLLDEPEDGLSTFAQLELLGLLWHVARRGGQVIMATHSPVLMAIPGMTLLDVTDMTVVPFEEVEAVRAWREFITDPRGTIKYVLAD